jgi:hypothetical protein
MDKNNPNPAIKRKSTQILCKKKIKMSNIWGNIVTELGPSPKKYKI